MMGIRLLCSLAIPMLFNQVVIDGIGSEPYSVEGALFQVKVCVC